MSRQELFSVRTRRRSWGAFSTLALLAFALGAPAHAQFAERASLVGSGAPDVDASGRSVKNPRVRAVHTTDPTQLGGTAYFISQDPFLAYQLGRNLNFREFRTRDGIFAEGSPTGVAGLAGPMVDGTTTKITANNQTSCLGCHNLPNGNPGGGANFAKDSGFGRNSPHYYGAGIMEMLAIQVRTELMLQVDTDADGWISAAEANAAPAPLAVFPGSGQPAIEYGSAALDGGATGKPQLNPIFRVWYGGETADGGIAIVPGATSVDGVTTTHYNFEMVVWGWGQRAPPSALNPTNRAFLWDPYVTHGGLGAHDPSTLDDPDGDGVSLPTLSGAVQFPATHRAPDAGVTLDPLGFSRDDPDGDGYLTEISEGDLDLAEFFMLNAPRPAFAGTDVQFARGVRQLTTLGCTECHVSEWSIRPGDGTFAGDRRYFDLDVTWNADAGRLEGELLSLTTPVGRFFDPRRASFDVSGLFTDLRHHDVGVEFYETAYDGHVNTRWRTPPLWGVGSGFPWGHDGASLTLDHVILRHGDEAQASRDAYAALAPAEQAQLIDFLGRMQLYDIESLPADIDGDGVISEHFIVAGMDTGLERFNAEWLFKAPVQIQGPVDTTTEEGPIQITSFAATNLTEAYGLDLPLRIDSDLDGWPDVWDHAPAIPGFKDGED